MPPHYPSGIKSTTGAAQLDSLCSVTLLPHDLPLPVGVDHDGLSASWLRSVRRLLENQRAYTPYIKRQFPAFDAYYQTE